MIKDRKGTEIKLGSKVLWYDPDEDYRDLSRVWTVYEITEEIVYLSDEFGETEVYPTEIEVID
jgi:hypothetical protein